MWRNITYYLPKFKHAVLTGLDEVCGPFSLRCQPQPDEAARVLRFSLPEYIPVQPGPACLLFHKHDDRLWNLLSFVVRGALERDGEGWLLRPVQFVPGVGIGGLMSYVRFLVNGRQTTNRYLRKRDLARPSIPWYEWQEVIQQAKNGSARQATGQDRER